MIIMLTLISNYCQCSKFESFIHITHPHKSGKNGKFDLKPPKSDDVDSSIDGVCIYNRNQVGKSMLLNDSFICQVFILLKFTQIYYQH